MSFAPISLLKGRANFWEKIAEIIYEAMLIIFLDGIQSARTALLAVEAIEPAVAA